jgi:putative (di)nucleoside polyphosphate hydrolase
MSRAAPDPRYRPNVGVALFNAQGLAFVGQRKSKGDFDAVLAPYDWQMPQGGVDAGEDPLNAALRELYEETNVRSVDLLGESPQWYSYDLPEEAKRRWKGKWIGQTQKWFAFRFTGDESEIDVHAPAGGAEKPEFIAWRWERLTALPDLIVPFKRAVYERVVADFAAYAAP